MVSIEFKGRHTGQEAVELHQELKVNVLALGRLAVCAAHMVTVQIDTCRNLSNRSISMKWWLNYLVEIIRHCNRHTHGS